MFLDIIPFSILLKLIYTIKPRFTDTFSEVIDDFMINGLNTSREI